MDLAKGVTFLVGENGSGKSTIVEGVALAFGLSPEGGSTHSQHATRPTESPLGTSLRVQRGLAASAWGFFLRAETMHGWYSYIEQDPTPATPTRASTSSATASRSSPCWRRASRAAGSTASTSPRRRCRSPRRWR